MTPEQITEIAEQIQHAEILKTLGELDQVRTALAQVRAERAEERAAVSAMLTAIREELDAPPPADFEGITVREAWLAKRAIGVVGALGAPIPNNDRHRLMHYRAVASVLGAAVAQQDPPPYRVRAEDAT